jgi:hypothetical protein
VSNTLDEELVITGHHEEKPDGKASQQESHPLMCRDLLAHPD